MHGNYIDIEDKLEVARITELFSFDHYDQYDMNTLPFLWHTQSPLPEEGAFIVFEFGFQSMGLLKLGMV
ncbi:UNVERIFIED_CONTAM: hypothetical protein NCL1_52600 [Trichonephila clavipes]